MSTSSALQLIVDITNPSKSGIIQSFQNRLPQTVPLFIRNDLETVSLRFVQPSSGTTRPWDDVDYSSANVIMGLGTFDSVPTSGTFTLQFGPNTTGTYSSSSTSVTVASATGITNGMKVSGAGIPSGTTCTISGTTVTLSNPTTAAGTAAALYFYNETSGIAVGAPASVVSTAVNALASVIAAGGVTVTSPESGVYLFVIGNSGLTPGYFNGNPSGANPSSSLVSSEIVVGATGIYSQQIVEIFQNPYALNQTWSLFPSASATVTAVSSGASYSPTGNNTLGSNQITSLSSTTGLVIGMSVSGTGVPANTTLLALSGTTATLSNVTTAGSTGGAYTFTTPSVQQITLTPGAYDGSFTITTPLLTTQAIAVPTSGATATAVQSALNNLGANYSVSGNPGGPFTISDPTGNNTSLSVNVTNLIVPRGLTGTLNLNTYSMLQEFISSGEQEITLELEIQVTPSGGGQSTPLQLSVNVNKNVINLSSLVPAPTVVYLTAAQVQAIINSLFGNASTSFSSAGTDTPTIPVNTKLFTYVETVGSGTGAYTRNTSLSATNRVAGDKACIVLNMPGSSNPTVNIKNNAGSIIWTENGTGVAYQVSRYFTFGTDWNSDQ